MRRGTSLLGVGGQQSVQEPSGIRVLASPQHGSNGAYFFIEGGLHLVSPQSPRAFLIANKASLLLLLLLAVSSSTTSTSFVIEGVEQVCVDNVVEGVEQASSFFQNRPTVANFCTKGMPFHRPAIGFLKQEARNWPNPGCVSMCQLLSARWTLYHTACRQLPFPVEGRFAVVLALGGDAQRPGCSLTGRLTRLTRSPTC